MEDVWRGEAQDLLTQIAQLQEENKSLLTNMSIKEPMSEEDLQKHEGEGRALQPAPSLPSPKPEHSSKLTWSQSIRESCRSE